MLTLPGIAHGVKTFITGKRDDDLTFWRTSLYDESQFDTYNPDDLVQKKGIKIYRKMYKDDQVKACMAIKRIAIYSKGWRIEPASDKPKDKQIAAFIEYALTDALIGSFRTVLKRMFTAFGYGFSVSEKIPYVIKNGEFAGKIAFKKIKTRPPDGFEFKTDDFGDVSQVIQEATGRITIEGQDLKRLVIYSYDSEFGDVWGNSDLRAAYRAWWSKDIIIRYLNIFIERFGMGILIGKYPRGMGKEARDLLQKVLKNISAKTAVDIPSDVEIENLESQSRTQPIHIVVIEHYNKSIARAILLPDKLGFTDSPGGSYNLGENQFSLFMMLMDNLRAEIEEEVVDEQIVRDLTDMNFANVVKYPKYKFNPLTQKDKEKLAEQFVNAVDKGVVIETEADEEFFRESIDYPKRDKLSPVIERPKKAAPFGGFGGDSNPNPVNADDVIEDETKLFAKIKLSRNPNSYEKEIDFKKTIEDLSTLEEKYELKIGENVDRIKEDLINSVISRKIVEEKKSREVDKITLKHLGDLRFTFGQLLNEAFVTGKKHGFRDVAAKRKGASLAKIELVGNLPPKEVLEFFEAKKFYLTGAERDHILTNAKGILYNSIESGATNAETIFKLEEFFEKYKVEQKMPSGRVERVEKIPGRIETVVRTNTNDAYNQGRLTSFQDDAVKDMIVAYEYSAIMDSRTSEICRGLDGLIYKTDDTIWAKITPPNHYNCRSLMIPILADETFTVSSPPPVAPAPGFGG